MIDHAEFAYAFWSFVLAVVGAVIAYAICHTVARVQAEDEDDEIVERTRLNIIVKWPR